MNIRVQVQEELLSDNSIVFNVLLNNVVLHAYSERDARMLSEQLRSAINVHTTDEAHILSDHYSE